MSVRVSRRVLEVAALVLGASLALAAPADATWDHPLPPTYTAPKPPGGQLEDRGSPMSSLTVVEGAFGRLPEGHLAAYAAPLGENAQLNVSTTDSAATTQLARYTMKGASGDSTIAVAPDGKVYIGSYYQGHLYQWDPATKTMTDLGVASPGGTYAYGLSTAPDGTVYGGAYPNARVWSYRPGVGFTDLGRITADDTIQYSRATAYDPVHRALYVGTQPVARLFRMDLDTGAVTRVELAAAPKTPTSIYDLDYSDGKIFVNYGGSLRVVDATTATEVKVTDGDTGQSTLAYPLSARGVSDARQGGAYFSSAYAGAVSVVRYDIATDTVRRTRQRATRGVLIGYGWNTENGHDVLYAFAGNYSGGGFRYDIDADTSGSMQFSISSAPSPLQHILPSADGTQVFVNAFLNGNTALYDVGQRTTKPITRLGQVEGWTLAGSTVQAGTYPNGSLVSIATSATSTTPLTTYVKLQDTDAQIRPIEAKEHGGRIWYGTEPDYGLRGGAIAILDPSTKQVDVTRNVVPDQTIASLAFIKDDVYAGSSTEGGTGTQPALGDGRLVQWDPASKSVLRSMTPVAGAGSINALAVHNDSLYGLADNILFEVDLATFQVRRTLDLAVHGGFPANSGDLVFDPNGYLYVSVGNSIVVVDPLAFTRTTIADDAAKRLQLSADGSLWTVLRPDGFENYLNLGRYLPAKTDCATPDARDYVTLFGVTTTVRNRFLETGCTLQDRFPLTATHLASYAGTVNPWLDSLVNSGQITQSERDVLWEAAKRGR